MNSKINEFRAGIKPLIGAMIGAGFAPVTFGKTFDAFGNYSLVLNIVGVMFICSAILMLTLGS